MFQNISIKNFRGIHSLNLEQLGQVNLFVGENNCGKTTVLESIFLLAGMSNPTLPGLTNTLRSKNRIAFDSLKYLFYGMDYQNHPSFLADMADGNRRELDISLGKEVITLKNVSSSSTDQSSLHGGTYQPRSLNLSFNIKKDGVKTVEGDCGIILQDDMTLSLQKSPSYHETINGLFLPANDMADSLISQLSELIKRKQKDSLLEHARLFDPQITNMELLPDGVYIGYDGIAEMLPLDLCGEGFKKFLGVIGAVVSKINQLVLIDELENGIHFSAYSKLWKGLIGLAVKHGVQLMISTHSKELVAELTKYLNESNLPGNTVCVYTLSRTQKNGLQAYRYTKDGLSGVLESDMEIRQ